jgi:hypothetical protein
MNQHVPPPQRPDEPPWMDTFRGLERSIVRHSETISKQVEHFIRIRRNFALWIGVSSMVGYWIGWGTVLLVQWLTGAPKI